MADPPEPENTPDASLENLARAAYESVHEEGAVEHDSLVEAVLGITGGRSCIQLPDLPGDEPTLPGAADRDLFPRYEIHGEIAHGGMGVVLKGRDRDLGCDVAIKVLDRRHAASPAMVQRFIEEAQIGGQLQHPGIVSVHEVGHCSDGRPFFAMKLVKGRTLSSLLKQREDPGRDRRRFLDSFEKICQTMAYAHARSVVHRDLKPGNIMVGAFGEVQVMDWGLAKVLTEGGEEREARPKAEEAARTIIETVRTGDSDSTRSQAGSVMGTPAYMPPEQARGEVDSIDERSDVFSLGAILCEMLTGEPPYVGDSFSEVRQKAQAGNLTEALARLDAVDLDDELSRLVRSCLAQEKGDRCRNAGEVADAVTSYLTSLEERVRAAEVGAARAEARAASERRVRQRTLMAAVSLVVAVALISGGFLWMEKKSSDRRAQVERKVTAALDDAHAARGRVGVGGEGDRGLWPKVLAEARRARALMEGEGMDPGLRSRVDTYCARVEAEAEAAREAAEQKETDRRMVKRLEEIRTRPGDQYQFDYSKRGADYAAAFREYGIDLAALAPEEAANRIRKSRILGRLTTALDTWADFKDPTPTDRLIPRKRLKWLVAAVDPLPHRNKYREARRAKDLEGLQSMARSPGVKDLPVEVLLCLARNLYLMGDRDRSTDLLRVVALRYPGDFWVHYRLARVLLETVGSGKEEAVRHALAAVAVRPGSAGAWNLVGLTFLELNRVEDAITAFEKAREINPELTYVMNNLAKCHLQKGDRKSAVEAYREASRVSAQGGESHFFLGLAHQATGNLDAALDSYRKATKVRPDHAKAHCNLGVILGWKGDLKSAVKAYRQAIEADPGLLKAHVNLADVLLKRNQLQEALDAVHDALEMDPGFAYAHDAHSRILKRMGRFDDSIEAGRKAVRLAPDNGKIRGNLGSALASRGKLKEALTELDRAVRCRPVHHSRHLNRGNVLARMRHWEKALKAFQEAARLAPEVVETRIKVGRVLDQLGRFEEAIASYRQGMELSPINSARRRKAAAYHEGARHRLRLAQKLEPILRGDQEPASASERIELAEISRRMGRNAASAELWQSAFDADPGLVVGRNLYSALMAAAQAGCGKGKDAGTLDEEKRARWRSQAAAWFRDYLEIMVELLDTGGEKGLRDVRSIVLALKMSPHLPGLLAPRRLSKLPEKDQVETLACFADLEALEKRCNQ